MLEVACGRGGFARWLASQPHRPACLVAADFSETAVRMAATASRRDEVVPIHWLVADIHRLPLPSRVFDTVISCDTIEHTVRPAAAVAELARVLKPGGRLFLTTPNYLGVMGLYRLYLRLTGRRYQETGQPINRVTLLPLTWLWVRRAGLAVELVDSRGHYLPWWGRPPIELAASLPLPGHRWLGLHAIVVARKPDAGPLP